MKPGRPASDACDALLQNVLQEPPYVPLAEQAKLHKRGLTGRTEVAPSTSWTWVTTLTSVMIAIVLVFSFFAVSFLWQTQWIQRGREVWHKLQAPCPASFLPFAQRHQEQSDESSPVCVRTVPKRWHSTIETTVTAVNREILHSVPDLKSLANSGLKRRVVPSTSCTNAEGVEIRGNTIWPEDELPVLSLTETQDFECAIEEDDVSEDDLLPAEISRKLSRKAVIKPRTHTKNASEGTPDWSTNTTCPKSRSSSSASLRQRVHSRWRKLAYIFLYDSSADELQPSLMALGEDSSDGASNGRRRKEQTRNKPPRSGMVLTGFVAIATVHAGATLASTVGVTTGQEILVQSEEGTRDIVAAMMSQTP